MDIFGRECIEISKLDKFSRDEESIKLVGQNLLRIGGGNSIETKLDRLLRTLRVAECISFFFEITHCDILTRHTQMSEHLQSNPVVSFTHYNFYSRSLT
jgi:hypothetical protein